MIKESEIKEAIKNCEEVIDRHEECDACVESHEKLKEILEYANLKLTQELAT